MVNQTYFWTYGKQQTMIKKYPIFQLIIKHCHYSISCLLNKLVAIEIFLTPILDTWLHLYIYPETDRKTPHLKSSSEIFPRVNKNKKIQINLVYGLGGIAMIASVFL